MSFFSSLAEVGSWKFNGKMRTAAEPIAQDRWRVLRNWLLSCFPEIEKPPNDSGHLLLSLALIDLLPLQAASANYNSAAAMPLLPVILVDCPGPLAKAQKLKQPATCKAKKMEARKRKAPQDTPYYGPRHMPSRIYII